MAGKLDATVADPGDALFERYADLGQTAKNRIPCLERDLHVPWIRAIREPGRQRNAVLEGRQECIGNRAWLNGRLIRRSSRRCLRAEIDTASRNWGRYPGFLTLGDDSRMRAHCRVPS